MSVTPQFPISNLKFQILPVDWEKAAAAIGSWSCLAARSMNLSKFSDLRPFEKTTISQGFFECADDTEQDPSSKPFNRFARFNQPARFMGLHEQRISRLYQRCVEGGKARYPEREARGYRAGSTWVEGLASLPALKSSRRAIR